MTRKYADVCSRCGATVIKESESDSSDMIEVKDLDLLYLTDTYLPDKHARPSLIIHREMFCPDCLVEELKDWSKILKTIKPSKKATVVTT